MNKQKKKKKKKTRMQVIIISEIQNTLKKKIYHSRRYPFGILFFFLSEKLPSLYTL